MNNKRVNKKLIYMRLCRVSLLSSFFFLALFIVTRNSSYIEINIIPYICLLFALTSYFLYIYYSVRYLSIKEKLKLSFISYFSNIGVAMMSLLCVVSLGVIYTNKDFKDWFVTTSMATMKHQYYCKIFYDEDDINEVLSNNYIVEVDEQVDTSLINPNETVEKYENLDLLDLMGEELNTDLTFTSEPVFYEYSNISEAFKDEYPFHYENEYEAQIFFGHTKEEKYRLIRTKVNKQDAYLAVIYDPSSVSVEVTKKLGIKGEYVTSMAKRTDALIAVNGGRFRDVNGNGSGGIPTGVTISKGEIVGDRGYQNKFGVIGINNDNILVLHKNINAKQAIDYGIRDAVTSGPFLIVNGKTSYTKGNGGYGYDARTAIGQRKDGIILLLVVDANDTRTSGASMVNLTKFFQKYGVINAAALDGGTSAVMVEKGVLISDPINSKLQHKTRAIATSVIVQ